VKVSCKTQREVAKQFKLCEGQVSRIVKRVGAWRGSAPRSVQEELSPAAEQRLGRWLARERAEEMYAEARRLVEEAKGEEDRGQKTGDSQADRLRWANLRLQAVKAAMRAGREAYELSQEEPLPEPKPAADDPHWRQELESGLAGLRKAAEERGAVPKSPNVGQFVESLVHVLLGEFPGVDVYWDQGPGSPRWELAAAWMRMGDVEERFWQQVGSDRLGGTSGGATCHGSSGSAAAVGTYGAQARKLEPEGVEASAASASSGASDGIVGTYGEPPAAGPVAAAAELALEKCETWRASELAHRCGTVGRSLRERQEALQAPGPSRMEDPSRLAERVAYGDGPARRPPHGEAGASGACGPRQSRREREREREQQRLAARAERHRANQARQQLLRERQEALHAHRP
jgi:hypothetical protein